MANRKGAINQGDLLRIRGPPWTKIYGAYSLERPGFRQEL